MTISPSENFIPRSDLETLWTDSNEPDAIGFEAWHRKKELFSISFEESGRRRIRFSFPPDVEFDAAEFRLLIDEAIAKLEELDAELRLNDGAWSDEAMGRSK